MRLRATGGVQFLRKISAGRVEFLIVSYWESYDAIRKFAGDRLCLSVGIGLLRDEYMPNSDQQFASNGNNR